MPIINCNDIAGVFNLRNEFALIDPGNDVHVWKVYVSDSRHLISRAAELMNDAEKVRAGNYLSAFNSVRFSISRITLRLLLGQYSGIEPSLVVFGKQPGHKPFLQNPEGKHLRYNISHSGDLLLIAIACSEVGIDLEHIDPGFSFEEVLPVCFSATESAYIQMSRPLFYKLWTRKEALRKATGMGIDDQLYMVPCLDGVNRVDESVIGSEMNWVVSSFGAGQQYVASLACQQTVETIHFIDFAGS